jgi:hypothetical protein
MRLTHEIKTDIKTDIKVAKKWRLHWRGGLCVAIGSLLITWLFDHFGRFDLARPSLFSTGIIAFTVGMKWKLRRYAWFWITITIIVALHVALIFYVPWTTNWVPAAVSAGICTVDFFVMLTILDAIETFLQRRESRRIYSLPRT